MIQNNSFVIARLEFLSDEAFIHHCFVSAFQCVCSPLYVNYYLGKLSSGTSRSEVAQSIFENNECIYHKNFAELSMLSLLDGEIFLREAYRKILGRTIDSNGLKHYLISLSNGEDKKRILYDIATSPEGCKQCSLHPDLNKFVGLLTKDFAPNSFIRIKHIRSLVALNDDDFIRQAYIILLKREADAAGLATYTMAINNNISKIKIISSLCNSPEGSGLRKTLLVRIYLILIKYFLMLRY